MALALRQFQRPPAQRRQVIARLQIEHSENRTHDEVSSVICCSAALMKSRPWMAGFALARMDPRKK
jgi:hypothetical protein